MKNKIILFLSFVIGLGVNRAWTAVSTRWFTISENVCKATPQGVDCRGEKIDLGLNPDGSVSWKPHPGN